jgi:hypothetical protein
VLKYNDEGLSPMTQPFSIARARVLILELVALSLVLGFTALFVSAYHAPSPHHLRLGVVADAATAARIQAGLDRRGRGAFDVRRYPSEAAAREALLHTTVQGVLVAGPGVERALVAGAFGAAPTAAVAGALHGLAAATGARVQVRDVKPLPAHDARGLSSLFSVLGTLLPSLAFGAVLALLGRGLSARARTAAIVAFGALAGVVVAFGVDTLLGALTGRFWAVAAVAGLLALAVAAATHGLGRLAGPPGVLVAVLVLLPLGLSSSGGAATPELLPGFYHALSGLLPAGAAVTGLRNAVYFDWAATLGPLAALATWALAGLGLGAAGHRGARAPAARRRVAP